MRYFSSQVIYQIEEPEKPTDLDNSTPKSHQLLDIFMELVPGGSIRALLNNYKVKRFPESLVQVYIT